MQIDDRDVSLNRSIKMWKNIPLDCRTVTKNLLEIDKYIQYPYIGMIFYSQEEDNYYKVLSLENGYKNLRSGNIVRYNENDHNHTTILKDYFVGNYEEFTLKGNSNTMISSAEIRNGYLYLIFFDGKETNVGYVKGDLDSSKYYTKEQVDNLLNSLKLELEEKIDNI